MKAEVEVTDTNWAGLFPGRLARACAAFEQTRVNDEVWLPRRVQVFLSARLGLVKMLHIEQDSQQVSRVSDRSLVISHIKPR